jgi:UDP:flavonoid glycosyltransferase YjiC (YdhE family)
VEALLTTGPRLDPAELGALPDTVHVESYVPQAAVLGHAAAVLCHGGSGTLLWALAAGLPLVVAPLFADQPDNAAVVAALGCGLVASATDAAAMGAALARVLSEPHFGERAGAVEAEIAALPDMDAAVAALEAMV